MEFLFINNNKKILKHRCFAVKLAKSLKASFLQKTSGCFWKYLMNSLFIAYGEWWMVSLCGTYLIACVLFLSISFLFLFFWGCYYLLGYWSKFVNTQLANIGPQDIRRTSPSNVPRASPKDLIWPSLGRPNLTYMGRPNLSFKYLVATYMWYKLVLQYFLGGQNSNLKIEGKINLLVTFIKRFVTQSKLSVVFTKALLFPHKTAYFSNNSHNTYKNGNSKRWN